MNTDRYVIIQDIPRELIQDSALPFWSTLAGLAEMAADSADWQMANEGYALIVDRTSAASTAFTHAHDDPVYGAYRAGDGVIRFAWPTMPAPAEELSE